MDIKDLFKPYKGDEPYMFVSYNHDDSDIVYDIISDLHSRGYRIWHDNGIPTGVNYVATLATKIKSCDVFLCFVSGGYITSDYCKQEMHYAFSNHRKVVPIMLENIKLPDEIAFRFAAINWTRLSRFDSEKELVDQLCEMDREIFEPCYSGEVLPPPSQVSNTKGTFQTWIKKYRIPAALVLAAAVAAVIWLAVGRRGGAKPLETEVAAVQSSLSVAESSAVGGGDAASAALDGSAASNAGAAGEGSAASNAEETGEGSAVSNAEETGEGSAASNAETSGEGGQVESPAEASTSEETASGKDTAVQKEVELVEEAELLSSGKRASEFLTERLEESCPLHVYDPEGAESEEDAFLYDNAVAAIAILTGSPVYKTHSEKDAAAILDKLSELVQNGAVTIASTDTKEIAAAAIAFLKYDKQSSSFSYVRCAQTLLDYVADSCSNDNGGFNSSASSDSRSTAGNIWLYSAFDMLNKKTGNSGYAECARSAQKFVQSMRASDGTYYLSGDSRNPASDENASPDSGFINTEVQALSAIAMNDRTGMEQAEASCQSEIGYAPDNTQTEGCSTEATSIMAIAYLTLGEKEKSASLLSELYSCQMSNGSMPEITVASMTDASGKVYKGVARTAAGAWYAMACAGESPFQY